MAACSLRTMDGGGGTISFTADFDACGLSRERVGIKSKIRIKSKSKGAGLARKIGLRALALNPNLTLSHKSPFSFYRSSNRV
jgi:hypothetical protein